MDLEQEIRNIEERNTRVEKDKAWETSWFRRLTIMVITFLAAALFLRIAGLTPDSKILVLSSLIPAVAFLFSTLTLPPLKKLWEKWQ